ncbi:MAG TPA: SH3 domain-containing protein, partial [Aggregatilineales bacterium]|nr:SH3 domain-containing protein [Aggregatilineales bacterium]
GQEIRLPYINNDFSAPASIPPLPVPYTPSILANFPLGLLDRPAYLPQPGYVVTDARVNLRTGDSTRDEIIYEVPSGQIMTILGTNPAGDWYHVRLANGQTGWMSAEYLQRNHGAINSVYDDTPLPPQRYGELGNTARVVAMGGVVMRQAPDASFPSIMTVAVGTELELLGRS